MASQQTKPPAHGGDMDPNENQYGQVGIQQGSTPSSAAQATAQGTQPPAHGGNMDPNDFSRPLGMQEPRQVAQVQDTTVASRPSIQPRYTEYSQQQSYSQQNSQVFAAQHAPYVPPTPPVPSTPQSQHLGQGLIQSPPQGQYYSDQAGRQPWSSGNPQSPHGYSSQNVISPQSSNYGYVTQSPPQDYVGYQPAGSPSYGASQTYTVDREQGFSPTVELGTIHTGSPHAARERGYANALHHTSEWRWKWPNTFQRPGVPIERDDHHHQDIMQRSDDFAANDYYLSPTDGHLSKLVVQCTQPITDADPNSTWRRTFIRNQSPYLLQAANWVLHSLPLDDREIQSTDVFMMGLKWLPSCAAILLLMIFPINASGEVRNGGCYDPFPYRFWGYPLDARNLKEDEAAAAFHLKSREKSSGNEAIERRSRYLAKKQLNPVTERPLEPKYLCFLTGSKGVKRATVSEWKETHERELTYIFISYTAEQFKTREDLRFLHKIGEHAARKAGATAYWVGCSCLGDESEVEENVRYISDIVRGSQKLVIAVQHPSDSQTEAPDTEGLLREWGKRVWTLPEVLLITSSSDIAVYARNGDIEQPMTINKRNFATMWTDAANARQLVDHYEGSLVLSSLELVTIALQCLHGRQTITHFDGDMANALMGLLRRRPMVTRSDSAFQAFARLSLANVNDLLLERLICVLPKSLDQPWYDMADQYEASLWDIYPSTQICGIGENDTVILDGAHAASIRWKAFAHVANATKDSWKRFFLRYAFRSASWLFITGISLISAGSSLNDNVLTGIGGFFLALALCFLLLSPYLIRVLYTGKLWATQPWFFGFEGYLDISTIEQKIFGAEMGHLKWSTNGSPLSVHVPNEHGECIGEDPTSNPETKQKVERSINCRMGDSRIFTLVDTNTLTVTMFEAVRPPIAVILCGGEGGMQRALLCSYEWSSQTLYRESVLRMETPVLEKLSRVGRLRLGLRRK